MNETTVLRKDMLESLSARGLSAKHGKSMGLEPLTAAQVKALKGISIAGPAIKIPYYTPTGKPTGFFRLRYMTDVRTTMERLLGEKPKRYTQPLGTTPEIYFAPHKGWSAWLQDADTPIVITEGEFKGACYTYHLAAPCIALGGVRSYVKDGKFHPDLEAVTWEGRTVIIGFDSDSASNPNVLQAEQALAKELLDRKASVSILRIPAGKSGQKQGLDDFIAAEGADELMALLESPACFEYALSSELHALNEEICLVLKDVHIYNREYNADWSIERTAQQYTNRKMDIPAVTPQGKATTKSVPVFKRWLEWPHRAEVLGRTFAPGQPPLTADGMLNTWKGWPVQPQAGDLRPWNMLMTNIFGNDTQARIWFEQWLAYPIQHPGAKMPTACMLWSEAQGTGKSFVGELMIALYGPHGTEIGDNELEEGRMEWAMDIQFCLADDITAAESRRLANKLKTMITQKQVRHNPKYVQSFTTPDHINYLFTSNDANAMALSRHDRRYFVYEAQGEPLTSAQRDMLAQFQAEGLGALFHHMLTMDLVGFDRWAPAPMTEAKAEMQVLSMNDLDVWCATLAKHPENVLGGLRGDLFTAKELLGLYDRDATTNVKPQQMGRALRAAGIRAVRPYPIDLGKELQRLVAVRNYEQWRKASPLQMAKHFHENRGPVKKNPTDPKHLRRVK